MGTISKSDLEATLAHARGHIARAWAFLESDIANAAASREPAQLADVRARCHALMRSLEALFPVIDGGSVQNNPAGYPAVDWKAVETFEQVIEGTDCRFINRLPNLARLRATRALLDAVTGQPAPKPKPKPQPTAGADDADDEEPIDIDSEDLEPPH